MIIIKIEPFFEYYNAKFKNKLNPIFEYIDFPASLLLNVYIYIHSFFSLVLGDVYIKLHIYTIPICDKDKRGRVFFFFFRAFNWGLCSSIGTQMISTLLSQSSAVIIYSGCPAPVIYPQKKLKKKNCHLLV
jgi:hypothetical protein